MNGSEKDKDDLQQLKREIVILQRKIDYLKFKNSLLYRWMNLVNLFVFIVFIQYILSYVWDFNFTKINNNAIQFRTYAYDAEKVKLYTIVFKYKNYFFKSKINKEIDKTIIYSDAMITRDLIFQVPQKFKLLNLNNKWFLVSESLGILTISCILSFVQVIAFVYKLNEQFYPLFVITILGSIALLSILLFSLYIHNFI